MRLHKLLLKLRLVAQRRPAWRPPVAHGCPSSTPRPRERGARKVGGRDGAQKRDDGSGDGDGDGDGGGGDGSPSRSGGVRILERGRAQP
jgi:hypothetical protein